MAMTRRLRPEAESRASSPRAWLVRAGQAERPLSRPAIFEVGSALELGRANAEDDPFMSARHVRLVRERDVVSIEDLESANGTRVGGDRVARTSLSDGDVVETGQTQWVFRLQHAEVPSVPATSPITSLSPTYLDVVARVSRIARTRVPALFLGASGTGKEVLARSLHEASGRTGSFVGVNAAAIQPGLLASELFGYERGAHSTADRSRPGLVRAAHAGTLLLDEIGDMPLEVQAALLRVLQEGEVVPVGGEQAVRVDVRVVAATHRDLDELVRDGKFRADLLARLAGARIRLPSLVDRIEDVGILAATFLERLGAATATFTPDAYRALFLYDWPLNIRELERAIEAAVAFAGDGGIELAHLPEAIVPKKSAPIDAESWASELPRLLDAHAGNVTKVAAELGRSRKQVHLWIKRLGLDPRVHRK
ncbi:MAG: sigma 54-interacting transcriptional regulator [Deltaproteobacteria bacterium]|nr:sigma 54-interacting transcriptional regulator [Deltaproteobacteria bacterium]